MKCYTIYAQAIGSGFSTQTSAYAYGTHRIVYKIYAASVKQAYFLAGHSMYATNEIVPGIREIYDGHTNRVIYE